jgi:hypothetical protein
LQYFSPEASQYARYASESYRTDINEYGKKKKHDVVDSDPELLYTYEYGMLILDRIDLRGWIE